MIINWKHYIQNIWYIQSRETTNLLSLYVDGHSWSYLSIRWLKKLQVLHISLSFENTAPSMNDSLVSLWENSLDAPPVCFNNVHNSMTYSSTCCSVMNIRWNTIPVVEVRYTRWEFLERSRSVVHWEVCSLKKWINLAYLMQEQFTWNTLYFSPI